VPSSDDPAPSGFQFNLPPSVRTALGGQDGPGKKVVVIAVDNEPESAALEVAFERRGWEVRIAEDILDVASCADDVRMLITDDFEMIRMMMPLNRNQPRPLVVALFKWHEDTWRYAQEAGADLPLPRPFDREDPLALWNL